MLWASRTKALVAVSLNDLSVLSVQRSELPVERRVSLKLPPRSTVQFVDEKNTTFTHLLEFEAGWLHLSVRVHKHLACESDCLISDSEQASAADLNSGKARGIRFQPFYLPGCKGSPSDLVGRGLFYRGLHFPGVVTPGSVSLSCICDHCRKSFRLQSFHSGFGNCGYLYSDSGLSTLIIDGDFEGYPSINGIADPEKISNLEARLPRSAKDHTAFRYLNPLRCPHCRAAYIDFGRFPKERPVEYYGNFLFGETLERFEAAC